MVSRYFNLQFPNGMMLSILSYVYLPFASLAGEMPVKVLAHYNTGLLV